MNLHSTNQFGVGDNVLQLNANNDDPTNPIPKTPGVVVGYIIAYPDEVSKRPWVADNSELLLVPRIYGAHEVMPPGYTVGAWMVEQLNA